MLIVSILVITELTWTQLYQYHPYNVGKSKEKKQLMLRPQYPLVKLKNEVSDVSSISLATVVADGNWQAGDLVDWRANGCYWSGHLTKLLGNSKAEVIISFIFRINWLVSCTASVTCWILF